MKYLVPLLAVVLSACGPAPQSQPIAPKVQAKQEDTFEVKKDIQPGCDIYISSRLENEHQVSDILNLETDTDPNGRCTVDFDLIVDGKKYHLTETERGWEKISSLCYYAKKRARENFLLSLGGKFKTKNEIDCRYVEKS